MLDINTPSDKHPTEMTDEEFVADCERRHAEFSTVAVALDLEEPCSVVGEAARRLKAALGLIGPLQEKVKELTELLETAKLKLGNHIIENAKLQSNLEESDALLGTKLRQHAQFLKVVECLYRQGKLAFKTFCDCGAVNAEVCTESCTAELLASCRPGEDPL